MHVRTALSGFVGRLFEEDGLLFCRVAGGCTTALVVLVVMAHLVRFFAFLDSDSSMGSSLW